MPTKKLPPLVSYRHQNCWRVITAIRDSKGKTVDIISGRLTYTGANAIFNEVFHAHGTNVIFCYIVAESDGIERR